MFQQQSFGGVPCLEPLATGFTSPAVAAELLASLPRAICVAVSLAGDAQTFVMLSDFTRPGNVAVDFVVAENGKSASLRICRASTATLAIEDCATSQEVELTLLSRRFNCRHLLTATITGTTGTCAQGVVYIGLPDGRPSEQEKMAVLKLATKIAATLPVQPPRLLIQLRQRGLLGAARCPMCGNCHATDATWFRNNSWTSAATREAYLTMPMTNTAVLASGGSGYVPQASGPSGSSLNQAMHMQPVPSPFQMTAELSGVQEALQPAGPGPMYTSRSMGAKVRGNFRRNSGFARNGSITSVSSLGKRHFEDDLMPVGPAGSGSMAAWRSVSMQPALGRQPASPTLVVPVSQPHMPAPAMKLRRNSVAASDVGWAATQGMTVSEQAPLGDWLQGQFQRHHGTPEMGATNSGAIPTLSGSHHADASATSTVETNTPLAPADVLEGVQDAWSPFVHSRMPNLPATPDTLLLPLSAPMATPHLMEPTMATYIHQDPRAVPCAPASNPAKFSAELQSALEEPLAWDPTAGDGLLDLADLDVLAALAGDDPCGGLEDKSSGCHGSGLPAVWATGGSA